MALDEFNEKSTMIIEVEFMDDEDDPVIPTSATYRLDTRLGAAIVVSTAIPNPMASSKELEITPAQNAVQATTKGIFEHRVLTVEFAYGAGREGRSQYQYLLRNLRFVT